jgi:predicted CoA-binding protein
VTAASDLEAFVRPRSIAVVGASERADAWGNWLFRKLLDEGFPGRLYPITRQAQTILGQPAYAQVSALPGPVDLAIIAIPASHIFETIHDCRQRRQSRPHYHRGLRARQDGRAQDRRWWRAGPMVRSGPNVSHHQSALICWPTLQNAHTYTRQRSPLSARGVCHLDPAAREVVPPGAWQISAPAMKPISVVDF